MQTVERVLRVTPSRQVARLEIYSQQEDGSIIALKDGEKVGWTAGDILQDLHFQMFDEADRTVPLTPSLARKIKVRRVDSGRGLASARQSGGRFICVYTHRFICVYKSVSG